MTEEDKNVRKAPPWLLSAEWGIGIDAYNWKLYRRLKARWNAVGYYPSLRLLVQSLQLKLSRSDHEHPTIAGHINAVIKDSERLTKAMLKHMNAINVGLDTKPPRYATLSVRETTE